MGLTARCDTGDYAPAHVHAVVAIKTDRELRQLAASTWRCGHCGHVESHDDPDELRMRACFHNRQHLES